MRTHGDYLMAEIYDKSTGNGTGIELKRME